MKTLSSSWRIRSLPCLLCFVVFAAAYLVSTLVLVWRIHTDVPTNLRDGDGCGLACTLASFQEAPKVKSSRENNSNYTVLFRDFVGSPEEHNTTVDGLPLPGPFYQDKLYAVGARLTTSFEHDDDSVHATLFLMPGDFWRRKKSDEIRCQINALNNGVNGTLLPHNKIISTLTFYVEVTGCQTCGGPIAMEYIPAIHGDVNVVNVTMIYTADLSPFVKRTHLSRVLKEKQTKRIGSSGSTEKEKAIRLSFSLEADDKSSILGFGKRLTHLATVDIPLSTGVVGHGGPHIRAASSNAAGKETLSNELLSPSLIAQKPVGVSLCVAVYGEETMRHLPEFVLHHLNVGFEHIVVGVLQTHLGSDVIQKAKSVLSPFLQQGTVVLAGMGLGSDLSCEINIEKNHFYNSCLYHSKGLAKYMGIWDIDEYWLPPLTTEEWLLPGKDLTGRMPDAIESLNRRLGQDYWTNSYYSKVPSILTVMESIQAYQSLNHCGEDWCFHAFPSKTAFRRRIQNENGKDVLVDGNSRTFTIHGDFERRDEEVDSEWSKSVTVTKNAHIAGIHMSGSCRWPSRSPDLFINWWDVTWNDEPYYDARYLEQCRNLRIEGFGLIHHFYSLNRMRPYDISDYNEELPIDEYAENFSPTVQRQLELLQAGM